MFAFPIYWLRSRSRPKGQALRQGSGVLSMRPFGAVMAG